MKKILNLVLIDKSDRRSTRIIVESFSVQKNVENPKRILQAAIMDFVHSGSAEAKRALVYANGNYNWGDAISTVPNDSYAKHGLTRLNLDVVDVYVDHDEVLFSISPDELGV